MGDFLRGASVTPGHLHLTLGFQIFSGSPPGRAAYRGNALTPGPTSGCPSGVVFAEKIPEPQARPGVPARPIPGRTLGVA